MRLNRNNDELIAPSRAMRARDIIATAVNDGKPLPLQVMLEAMWMARDKLIGYVELQDQGAVTQWWEKTLKAAEKVAPYVHPHLATETVDTGLDGQEGRAVSAWSVMQALRGKSDEDLHEAYQALVKGEEVGEAGT